MDDAEAKRRGVPVIVVRLEGQLRVQKGKTAEVEKQIAEVQKKIEELKAPKAARAAKGSPANVDPVLPKAVEGPRKANAVYDDIVARYMAGDWSRLTQDIGAKGSQINALSPGNAADLSYIKAALLQCRPAWWGKFKGSGSQTFEANVFKHKVTTNWTVGSLVENASLRNGKVFLQASWPANWTEGAQGTMQRGDLAFPSGDYSEGDMAQFQIWHALGRMIPLLEMDEKKVALLTPAEEHYVTLHQQVLGVATGAYYTTPPARYLGIVQCQNGWDGNRRKNTTWEGRRLFSAFLVAEFMAHRERYPNLHLKIPELPEEMPKSNPEESLWNDYVSSGLMSGKLTFAEDCALRQAIWEYVATNNDWTADRINLPGGIVVALDEKRLTESMNERWKAFRQLSLAQATQPAATGPSPAAP
jgi:hypothetical protein